MTTWFTLDRWSRDSAEESLRVVSELLAVAGGAWAYAADLKALPYYEPALDLTAEWEAIKNGRPSRRASSVLICFARTRLPS